MPLNGIRLDGAVLLQVGRVEQGRIDDVAAAERWLGAELFEHQLLHRVVEQSPTGPNTGLARVARTPCNSNPRRECFVIGRRQASRHAGIAGDHQT